MHIVRNLHAPSFRAKTWFELGSKNTSNNTNANIKALFDDKQYFLLRTIV